MLNVFVDAISKLMILNISVLLSTVLTKGVEGLSIKVDKVDLAHLLIEVFSQTVETGEIPFLN